MLSFKIEWVWVLFPCFREKYPFINTAIYIRKHVGAVDFYECVLPPQVSQVYQTIAFSRLADLIPFASKFRLERVIVDAAKTLELQVSGYTLQNITHVLTLLSSLVVYCGIYLIRHAQGEIFCFGIDRVLDYTV